jgi:hypothetical protein
MKVERREENTKVKILIKRLIFREKKYECRRTKNSNWSFTVRLKRKLGLGL